MRWILGFLATVCGAVDWSADQTNRAMDLLMGSQLAMPSQGMCQRVMWARDGIAEGHVLTMHPDVAAQVIGDLAIAGVVIGDSSTTGALAQLDTWLVWAKRMHAQHLAQGLGTPTGSTAAIIARHANDVSLMAPIAWNGFGSRLHPDMAAAIQRMYQDRELMTLMDADKNGSLSRFEVETAVAAMLSQGLSWYHSQARPQVLSWAEKFARATERKMQHPAGTPWANTPADPNHMLRAMGAATSDFGRAIDQIAADLDPNKDGMITVQEMTRFVVAATEFPLLDE
jgi:hypothetical protein